MGSKRNLILIVHGITLETVINEHGFFDTTKGEGSRSVQHPYPAEVTFDPEGTKRFGFLFVGDAPAAVQKGGYAVLVLKIPHIKGQSCREAQFLFGEGRTQDQGRASFNSFDFFA